MSDGLILDALFAQSEQAAQDFWTIRAGHALDSLPLCINFDVSLPIGLIEDYVRQCRAALEKRWPGLLNVYYGHVGDSNLHISVSVPGAGPEVMHDVDEVVYEALRPFGGSISAEHGIGTLKRPYLGHSRGPAELALMGLLKKTLDPRGILNPGKVI